jgi:hypothetical protein
MKEARRGFKLLGLDWIRSENKNIPNEKLKKNIEMPQKNFSVRLKSIAKKFLFFK